MERHDVFEEVKKANHQCISSRWVVTEKFKNGKQVVKARLVARGFEEDSTNLVKYSPTCSRESLRLLFTVAATMNWKLQSVDITCAFLQGNTIDREVYLQLPKDIKERRYSVEVET